MKELLEYLAVSLVDHPDAVRVDEVESGESVTLNLHVDPEDVGKVIGRQGRIAKAMRTLVRSSAHNEGKKVTVEIVG